jgi:AbrB family looped-hinge helix DNA binding protein
LTNLPFYLTIRFGSKTEAAMLTTLSSKGQLIIPKPVRKALKLQAGDRFRIQVEQGKIILEPATSPIEALYGKYACADFLTDLEAEHQQEIRDEAAVRA